MSPKKSDDGSEHAQQSATSQKSVTIDRDLMPWVEEQIQSKRFRSLSHMVSFAMMRLMQRDEEAATLAERVAKLEEQFGK